MFPPPNLAVFFFPFFIKSRQTDHVLKINRPNTQAIPLIICSLLFWCLSSFIGTKAYGFRLLIDPGHGGNDRGAYHFNQKEKKLTLLLAQKIRDIIQKEKSNWRVHLTRDKDQYVALEKRVQMAEPFDLLLSLHANSSELRSINGMEVYFQPDQAIEATSTLQAIVADLKSNAKTQQSLALSRKLQENWQLSPSIIRRTPFFVIEKGTVPAVLIEVGFMSNANELQKLMDNSYQDQIAQSIVNALITYHSSLE